MNKPQQVKALFASRETKTFDGRIEFKKDTYQLKGKATTRNAKRSTNLSQLFIHARSSQQYAKLPEKPSVPVETPQRSPPIKIVPPDSTRHQPETAIPSRNTQRNTKQGPRLANPTDLARGAKAKYGHVDKNLLYAFQKSNKNRRAFTKSKLWMERQNLFARLPGLSTLSSDLTNSLSSVTGLTPRQEHGKGATKSSRIGNDLVLAFGEIPETPQTKDPGSPKTKRNYSQEPIRLGTSWISNRKEVVALAEWVLEQVKIAKAEGNYFEKAIDLYNTAIKKLVELITEGCKEQGIVLSGIWAEYDKLIRGKIESLEKRTEEREQEINQLSCNLVNKFEKKFKEYEGQIKGLKSNLDKHMTENKKMREMVKDYEEDQDTLLEKYVHLKEANKKLKKNVEDLVEANKALKIILLQSDARDELSPSEVRDELLKLKIQGKSPTKQEPVPEEEEVQLRTQKYKKLGTLVSSVDKAVARMSKLTLGTARRISTNSYKFSDAIAALTEREGPS